MSEVGQEIRFIAKSAKEAAEVVRERLGAHARVISVRQVTGTGLQRFLASPRLEVVARRVAAVAPPEVDALPAVSAEELTASKAPPTTSAPVAPEATRELRLQTGQFLERAGFTPQLMARLEGASAWRALRQLPPSEGLPRAVAWLRHYRKLGQVEAAPSRLAFIGAPGAGKTTSLCKLLAREVFLHGRSPEVLKLDVDKPHLDNGLSLYCEILGVPCHEDPEAVADIPHLLVDVPGFSVNDEKERQRVVETLDALQVPNRIWVQNAAYEAPVLERFASEGRRMGAGYQVLTRLDEVADFGKLWSLVLDPEMETLFLADGQNVAGDLIDDAFGFLMERTFPQ